jgi:hypothetical protein
MSATKLQRFQQKFMDPSKDDSGGHLWLCIECACDGDGNRLFSWNDEEQLRTKKGAGPIVRLIADAAILHNTDLPSPEALGEE